MTVYTSRFGFKWNYQPHDTGWGTDYNFAHRELAAVLHLYIISDAVTTPPGSPAENDTYLVPLTGTGAWSTQIGKIASYQGGAWQYYTPEAGTRARIANRDGFYWYDGSIWNVELTSGGGTYVQTVAGHAPDLAGNVALVVGDITGAAPLSSPALTGTPTAPTRAANNNSTGVATTEYVDRAITAIGGVTTLTAGTGITLTGSGAYNVAVNTGTIATHTYVDSAIAALVNSAPSLLDTLGEIATELTSAESTATALATTVAAKVAKAGDTMTGDLHLSAPGGSDNTDKAVSSSWVRTYVTGLGFGTGSGSVTSVGLTVPSDLTITGSPVTGAGTLAITRSSQDANLVLAGPSTGAAAAPVYRALVAADIPVQPYVVSGFYPGVPGNSQLMLVHQAAMAFTFPANFGTSTSGAASKAGCTVNATGSTVISIDRCLAANDPTTGGNWTAIGTATIGAGGHAATLATTSGTSKAIAAGDFLRAVGPATADGTAANVFLTLAGDR